MRYIFVVIVIVLLFLIGDFRDIPNYTGDQVIAAARDYSPDCREGCG